MSEITNKKVLAYHQQGKIGIDLTKSCDSQHELSMAYTPGVAIPCLEIAKDKNLSFEYTNRANLVAVVSDGTAVLGLGDIGPEASKPVMEGKSVLFKKFANVDAFDIELDVHSVEEIVATCKAIAPTFGGINLEDISAPRCFEIERILKDELDIPVFHDDQHGTAIIIAAGLLNALDLKGKKLEDAKIVCLGAGAAGIASMQVLTSLGASKQNLFMLDRGGVIHTGRDDLNKYKQEWAVDTDRRTLLDACTDADVFIGLSGPNLMSVEALKVMADNPIVFALSNPDPEIDPALAREARPDIIMATGRSDYPNQVNNVLGFPFIFRGALDVRATHINTEMKMAAVKALAAIAKEPVPDEVLKAYNKDSMEFGPEYIIPTPLDPRLPERIPAAISQAAIDSGVARIKP